MGLGVRAVASRERWPPRARCSIASPTRAAAASWALERPAITASMICSLAVALAIASAIAASVGSDR